MFITTDVLGWLLAGLSILLWLGTNLKSKYSKNKKSSKLNVDVAENELERFWREKELIQDSIIYFANSLFRQNTEEDILWDITINCIDKFGFVDCVIYLIDEDRQVLVQKAAHGPKNDGDKGIVAPIEIPVGSGIVGSVFKTGAVELLKDVTLDSRYILDDEQRMSELAVPIITPTGKVLGVIDSEHPEKGFFTQVHSTVLRTIASICAIKLVKAQADKDLLKAKEKAEEATKIKSQFLSTMSHEIRNPLNAVIGMSNLLMDENPSEAQLEFLRPLHLSSKHLLSLVNDILDYSKLDVGKVKIDHSDFNLATICEDLYQNFAYIASSKGLQLKFNSIKVPYLLRGDVTRINQILNNLIGNAIKFTERGSVSVRSEILEEDSPQCRLKFSVKDTGIGIHKQEQEKVFRQFEQLKGGKTRKYEGTGLGLAICKKLVDLLGGEMGLTSALGEGSEFWFWLPVEKGELIDMDAEIGAEKKSTNTSLLAGMKVLLVEDHIVNQKIVSKLMQKWKVDLAIAEDGNQALDVIMNNPDFDLVLMDLHMPVVGGFEATKLIRAQKGTYFKHIPIIALTADVSADVKEETLSIGMNDFISKPFDPLKLFEVLNKFYSAA